MKRTGKKCTSTHTTVTESAALIVDFGNKCSLVSKISLGIIKMIPNSRGGTVKRIKFIQETACLCVKVRGNRSIQELRFYTAQVKDLETEIRKYTHSLNFEIS